MLLAGLAAAAALAAASASVLGVPHSTASSTRTETTGVVVVQTQLASGDASAGTGIVLTSSGEVLTNNHVIRGARAVRVTDAATGRTYSASIAGYSVARDVALLRLRNAHDLQTARLGDSDGAEVGSRVVAVGNAGGTGVLRIKTGRIVRVGRTITVTDDDGTVTRLSGLIQTSAPLRPGDSGGPLLSGGRVIGMDAAASRTFEFSARGGDGYAIPIDVVARIARQIETGHRTSTVHVGPTAFLGVALGGEDPQGSDSAGALVHGVSPGSPADQAGLGPGDLITSFGGRRVDSARQLRSLVLRMSPGQIARLTWSTSGGGSQAASVRLASGPPQ